jgi:hypothetical protein
MAFLFDVRYNKTPGKNIFTGIKAATNALRKDRKIIICSREKEGYCPLYRLEEFQPATTNPDMIKTRHNEE